MKNGVTSWHKFPQVDIFVEYKKIHAKKIFVKISMTIWGVQKRDSFQIFHASVLVVQFSMEGAIIFMFWLCLPPTIGEIKQLKTEFHLQKHGNFLILKVLYSPFFRRLFGQPKFIRIPTEKRKDFKNKMNKNSIQHNWGWD